jgi:hypothetical protein
VRGEKCERCGWMSGGAVVEVPEWRLQVKWRLKVGHGVEDEIDVGVGMM